MNQIIKEVLALKIKKMGELFTEKLNMVLIPYAEVIGFCKLFSNRLGYIWRTIEMEGSNPVIKRFEDEILRIIKKLEGLVSRFWSKKAQIDIMAFKNFSKEQMKEKVIMDKMIEKE